MRVVVSAFGRFHLFDLARQLQKMGILSKLFTGYPIWKVDADLRSATQTFPYPMLLSLIANRLKPGIVREHLEWLSIQNYDRWFSRRLPPCDVVVALSGRGLHTFREARKRGALAVCDRGSTHILSQDEILAEEHRHWGLPYRAIASLGKNKEISEYTEADLITMPSDFVKETFIQHGVDPAKVIVLPYGVDLDLFRPMPKEDQVFRVVYVGGLSIRKGILYLLEAMAPLIPRGLELCLIGSLDPQIAPFLKKYKGLYRYLGFIPRTQLAHYYSQGSVFVIASVEEGLALVQAQAMACGLPVIATRNAGAENLFKDGVEGYIVPARSPEALREKIVYLYEHPKERDAMALAALERVKRLDGWSEYGKHAKQIYQSALRLKDAMSHG